MNPARALRALGTGTRLIVGAVVAVALVVAVVLAIPAPIPTMQRDAVALVQTPTPSDTVAVCPGPLLAAGRVIGQAGQLSVAAGAQVTRGGVEARSESLRSSATGEDVADTLLRAAPVEGRAAEFAAAQSTATAADDLSGFAASACTSPRFDSWLAAGATSTGAADLVSIANPGDVTATVDITVFGQSGPVVPPGGEGVVVAARSQVTLPLAGLALGELAPVLRLQAIGAPVVVSLQSSRTVTLEPVGLDVSGPAAPPAPSQTIPGVVTTTASDPAVAGSVTARVRLLSASEATTATVTVFAEGSDTPAIAPAPAQLQGGIPVELELPGLAAGAYTVRVDASAPVVASAWTTSALGGQRDFSWLPAPEQIDGATLVAVAEAPDAVPVRIHIATLQAAADVTLTPVVGGDPQTLALEPGDAGALSVPPGTTWRIETIAPVVAAVSYAATTALAGYGVQPAPSAASAVRVLP